MLVPLHYVARKAEASSRCRLSGLRNGWVGGGGHLGLGVEVVRSRAATR